MNTDEDSGSPPQLLPAQSGNTLLTMSTREIADLTGKRHDNVMRDTKAMIEGLGMVPLSFEGYYVADNGKRNPCFDLPEDLSITLVAGYDVVLRKKIVDAWLARKRLPATVGLPPDVMEMIRRDDGISRMLAHKVTGIEATVATINNALAAIAERLSPAAPVMISRQGMTAGQIWRANGFTPLRSTSWFGNRLTEMGCAMPDQARGQLGDNRARLFDPDKAAAWIKTGGGKAMVDGYIKERAGQAKLEGV